MEEEDIVYPLGNWPRSLRFAREAIIRGGPNIPTVKDCIVIAYTVPTLSPVARVWYLTKDDKPNAEPLPGGPGRLVCPAGLQPNKWADAYDDPRLPRNRRGQRFVQRDAARTLLELTGRRRMRWQWPRWVKKIWRALRWR